MQLKLIYWICLILVIIGGINWGLVGLFNFDLVAWLLGPMSVLSRIVYVIVGLGALSMLILIPKIQGPKEQPQM